MSLLIDETSRCVKCGLCLAECPTYALNQNEAYSPRGRIALIEALAKGHLAVTCDTDKRLDSCLLCRRCEKICPSGVRFGSLMDEARTMTQQLRPFWLRSTVNILTNPKKLKSLTTLGKTLPMLTSYGSLLKQAGTKHTKRLDEYYPSISATKGKVGLFTGCTGNAFELPALHSAVRLLTYAGYEVLVPRQQTCCGALHTHLGDARNGEQMLRQSMEPFLGHDLLAVINITSGCSAQLRNYTDTSVKEAHQFIVENDLTEQLNFKPVDRLAALHIPCSLENSPIGSRQLVDLLKKIPQIDINVVGKPGSCCGAAGSYFLSHPKTAGKLKTPLVKQIDALSPDYLVSSNIGCALHLANGMDISRMEVLHPLTLLARALDGQTGV